MKLLNDKEWAKWSDREIARRCNVSNNFVGTLRPSLSSKDSERTYTTKHGTVAKMDTSNVGHRNTVPVQRQYNQSYEASVANAAIFSTPTPVAMVVEPMPEQVIGEEIACEVRTNAKRFYTFPHSLFTDN